MAMLLLASCDAGSGRGLVAQGGDTIALMHAEYLTMVDYGDYVRADFSNPWDPGRVMQTFLLVPRDRDLPAGLPKGTVVRTPVEKSIVYTSAHSALLSELGAIDAIAGVCDAKYIGDPEVAARIRKGQIADCGQSMAPGIERMLQLKPEAILLSAYENSNDHNKVAQLGIPIVDCIDYMEASPLARAEWMRFFGRLYGKGAEADSLFSVVEREYDATKALVSNVPVRPKVLTELVYGQSWAVPAAYSTVGMLIKDAGGANPFAEYKKSGSVQLAPEEVLYKAKDADVWLIKYSQAAAPTLSQLAADNPVYAKLRPFATGQVYGCDTNRSSYFDDLAFHPQWILAEYMRLIHPEIQQPDSGRRYYELLSR